MNKIVSKYFVIAILTGTVIFSSAVAVEENADEFTEKEAT